MDLKVATGAVKRLIALLTYGEADESLVGRIPRGTYIRSEGPNCRAVGFSFDPPMNMRGCFPANKDADNGMVFRDVEASIGADGVNAEGWSVLASEALMGSEDIMTGPWPMRVSFLQHGDRGYGVICFMYQQNGALADWGIRDVSWFPPNDDGYLGASQRLCNAVSGAKIRAIIATQRAERLLQDRKAA